MKDSKIIPIEKEYDKEEVYRAVLTYMQPSSDKVRITTEVGTDSYIIKTQCVAKKKKKDIGEWVETSVVKLTFSKESCYVDIDFIPDKGAIGKSNAVLVTGGAASLLAGLVCFPIMPVALFGTFVAGGVVNGEQLKAAFQKFKKDIYELVEGYLCVKGRREISTTERKCECGAVLPEGAKFCAVCGKKVEEQQDIQPKEIVCECGNILPEGTKFCPMCGKGVID